MAGNTRGYIVAYDIEDDRQRSHVAKLLQRYGMRLQYSVFLLEIRPSRLLELRQKLIALIDGAQDSIVICGIAYRAQIQDGLTFIGNRGYTSVAIPSVI